MSEIVSPYGEWFGPAHLVYAYAPPHLRSRVDRDAVRDAAVEQVVRAQHTYVPALVGAVYAAHCCCGWTGVDRYYTEDSAQIRTVEHVEAVVAEALAQAGAA